MTVLQYIDWRNLEELQLKDKFICFHFTKINFWKFLKKSLNYKAKDCVKIGTKKKEISQQRKLVYSKHK